MRKIAVAAFLATTVIPVWAAEKVLLEAPITYAANLSMSEKLKQECNLDKQLETRIGSLLAKRNSDGKSLLQPDTDSTAAVLRVQITVVMGAGGGGWTGNKSTTIRATLLENGKVVQSQRISKTSKGGIAGPFMGTCDIFDYIAGKLADDIAPWAYEARPSLDQDKQPPEDEGKPVTAAL